MNCTLEMESVGEGGLDERRSSSGEGIGVGWTAIKKGRRGIQDSMMDNI